MIDNKPQGLISDGIALMQKGHLTSASALFEKAVALGEFPLTAQLLNASCKSLSIFGTMSQKLEDELLRETIPELEMALDQCRDKADTIKRKLEAEYRRKVEASESEVSALQEALKEASDF